MLLHTLSPPSPRQCQMSRNDVDGLNIRMSSIEVSFDDYLKSHNKEVELIIQNLNYKIDHIAEELEQIKILEKKQLNEIQK